MAEKDKYPTDKIAKIFEQLRFQKTRFGGVSEADVWKKLGEVQKQYRMEYRIQQERYHALLEERDAEITRLKQSLLAKEEARGRQDE